MRSVLSIAFVLVLIASNAFAAAISVSVSAPNTNVQIASTSSNNGSDIYWRPVTSAGEGTRRIFGQTFTVTTGFVLEKVSFLISQENDPGDRSTAGLTMQADVFGVSALTDTSGPTVFGGAQSGVTPGFNYAELTWLTFDVDDVFLAPGIYGTTIGFAFGLDDSPALEGGHKISNDGVRFDSNGPYADGEGFRLQGDPPGGNNLGTGNDLAFSLQGSVPEPTGFILAGLGLVGFTGYRVTRRSGRSCAAERRT